jgi:hypothetical protein
MNGPSIILRIGTNAQRRRSEAKHLTDAFAKQQMLDTNLAVVAEKPTL